VEDAWVEQYTRTVGIVNLDDQKIDEQCLAAVEPPAGVAVHTLPVCREMENLNLATSPENLVAGG